MKSHLLGGGGEMTLQSKSLKNLSSISKEIFSDCKNKHFFYSANIFFNIYFLFPNNRKRNKKRLMKSRYKVNAPIITIF